MFSVKLARVPGETKEIVMDGSSATVSEVLAKAGTEVNSGENLKVAGVDANADTIVSDGMRITLVRGAKGNK